MADLSKIKRRTTLGPPPPFEEASQNLQAPEIAPVMPSSSKTPRRSHVPLPNTVGTPPSDDTAYPKRVGRVDGRSLRRTGRTLQLATRVSWEFDEKLRRIAQRDGLKLGQIKQRYENRRRS